MFLSIKLLEETSDRSHHHSKILQCQEDILPTIVTTYLHHLTDTSFTMKTTQYIYSKWPCDMLEPTVGGCNLDTGRERKRSDWLWRAVGGAPNLPKGSILSLANLLSSKYSTELNHGWPLATRTHDIHQWIFTLVSYAVEDTSKRRNGLKLIKNHWM